MFRNSQFRENSQICFSFRKFREVFAIGSLLMGRAQTQGPTVRFGVGSTPFLESAVLELWLRATTDSLEEQSLLLLRY